MKIGYVTGIFDQQCIQFDTLMLSAAAYCRIMGFNNDFIYDPSVNGDSIQQAEQYIYSEKPDVLVLSAKPFDTKRISSDVSLLLKFVERIKRKFPKIIVLMVGEGPSLQPEKYLAKNVDAVLIGEYEISLYNFIKNIYNKEDYLKTPGIAYRSANKIVKTICSEVIENLDMLPFMARDTLPLLIEKYGHRVSLPVIGSRGCYRNCSFCISQPFRALQNAKKYRSRSVDNIVREIETLIYEYGVKRIDFLDDTFIPAHKVEAIRKIDDFCNKIKQLNYDDLEFFMQFRVDNFDEDIIKKLIRIGLNEIYIGIESFNQEDLDLYRKYTRAQDNIDVLYRLEKMGFKCEINSRLRVKLGFINFHPYATIEGLKNNLFYLKKFNVTPKKFCSVLLPHYGTNIYNKFKRENLINSFGEISFKNPNIDKVFFFSKQILNLIMNLREKVRLINKMHLEFQSDYDSVQLSELDIWRKELDSLCYNAFEEILSENEVLEEIYNKYQKIVDDYTKIYKKNYKDITVIKF